MSSSLQRKQKLAALAARKTNKNKKRDLDDDIYDNVEEDDVRFMPNDEDFVEDDDQAGYIDDGFDDEEYEAYSDDGDVEGSSKKPNKRKRKDTTSLPPKDKVKSKTIETMFSQSAKRSKAAKPQTQSVKDDASDDFMTSILSSIEAPEIPNERPRLSSRIARTNPAPRSLEPTLLGSTRPQKKYRLDDVEPAQLVIKSSAATNDAVTAASSNDPIGSQDEFFDAVQGDVDMLMEYEKQHTTTTSVKKQDVERLRVSQVKDNTRDPAPKKPMKYREERPDLQAWENAEKDMMSKNVTSSESVQDDVAPNMEILEDDGSVHMWWYDAAEVRERGIVYLFGKIYNKSMNRYVSCCLTVKNIERNIFVLPREYRLDEAGNTTDEEVGMADVHAELSEIFSKYKISKWMSKPVERKYAFEIPEVPAEAQYMKVIYSYNQPSLPTDLNGTTFSHVFGANTSPLEHFLVKRDIMGPCWLKIENPRLAGENVSWCKAEVVVDDPKSVNPLRDANGNPPSHIPPLVVLALSIRTVMNHQKKCNEIVAASGLVCTQVQIDEPTPIEAQPKARFAIVRQLNNTPYPAGFSDLVAREKQQNGLAIQVERNENSLLNCLLAKIHVFDPDVVVGHNFAGFDLDVLLHRMKACYTQHWHKLGRLRRKHWPKLQSGPGGSGEATFQERMIMSGRLVCDTYLAAKDLIRSKSYRLTDLVQSQLKIAREDIEFDRTASYFEDAKSLIYLVKHCSFDAFLATALMFKLQILPLTKQLTNLAGNLWSRTMTGARAERNEYLLLHEFHRQKYICPDKVFNQKASSAIMDLLDNEQDEELEELQSKKARASRRKPAYTGGLVLEPKRGFYDKYVLLLDFNSLYPSIIQEYNVCFTTVNRHQAPKAEEESVEDRIPDVPDQSIPQGVLPRIIKTLVDRRRQVKKIMKDPKLSEAEMMQLDIRQKALKLTANSMYGCLGFSHSRFYAKPLAMLITHMGRRILQNTVDLAGTMDLNVIYGDTDSIMVYTNENDLSKVKEIGNMLKRRVNERYNLLEIDIDGFFKHMLLLKKKKYAALLVEEKPDGTVTESVETKGLDLVRRDWCDLSHDVSSHVLSYILSDRDREDVVNDIHSYLQEVGEKIRNGGITLDKYIINKQLTKNPEEYADAKSQPHVQVALRMRQRGVNVKAGDTVPYVICQVPHIANGVKTGFAEKAYHPDDVMRGEMQLDIEWYLNQQVHPPVARLCSPIEGTDAARLAECLGLDARKYNIGQSSTEDDQSEEFLTLDSQISDAERFKHVEKLMVVCSFCKTEQEFRGITRKVTDHEIVSGLECSSCGNIMKSSSIANQMVRAIRSHIRRYYDAWLICDDTTCEMRTRMMSVFGRRCLRPGCHGAMKREYTDKSLYTQLLYYTNILNTEKAMLKASESDTMVQVESLINKHRHAYSELRAVAEKYLQRSGYRHVDIGRLMAEISLQ